MKKAIFAITTLSFLFALSFPAFADIKSDMAQGLPLGQVLGNAVGDKPTCEAIKAAIEAMVKNGASASDVIKAALGSGYDANCVLSGALMGDADATTVKQAALAAGLDEKTVDNIISDYIAGKNVYGYSTPTGNGGGDLGGGIPSGGGGGGGGSLSPH